ncbi:MAG: hypothetical protein J6X43_04940, partial [Bacteroidales bacterium]|nr:hypothetical protein [Bacteroidales bacterium]
AGNVFFKIHIVDKHKGISAGFYVQVVVVFPRLDFPVMKANLENVVLRVATKENKGVGRKNFVFYRNVYLVIFP